MILKRKNKNSVAALFCAALVAAAFVSPGTAEALTSGERCVKDKLKVAGKHASGLAKCFARVAKTNDFGPSYGSCLAKVDGAAQSKLADITLKIVFDGGRCGGHPGESDDLLLTGTNSWMPALMLNDLFPPVNTLPNLCVMRKIRGAGKYASKVSKCLAKDYIRPDALKKEACLAKSKAKLEKDYAKADSVAFCEGSAVDVIGAVSLARVNQQIRTLRFGGGFIQDPSNGAFSNGTSISVFGGMTGADAIADLTVNDVSQLPLDFNNTFTTSASLDPGIIFNPIYAELTTAGGDTVKERVTVVVGDGVNTGFVLDGDLSPESIGMRLTDTGLNSVTPIVAAQSAGALDIGPLLTEQNPVLDDECVFYIGALCGYWATVNVVDVNIGGFDIGIDPRSGVTDLDVTLSDFSVDIDLHVRDCCAVSFDCGLNISASTAVISSAYDMVPLASNPSKVDVNQVGALDITLGGFSHDFTSGICDAPVIGDIIDSIVGGTLSDLVSDGFADGLGDPDGAGPGDSPIADGIEAALDAIDIAGPVGETIGVTLDAEFSAIAEDEDGITFKVDAGVTADSLAPGAPDLPASFTVTEPFPTYGPLTPGGLPYGVGLGLGSSGLNQLLKGQIETGLLQAAIGEFDLGGGPVPLTAGLLAALVPALSALPAAEPVIVEITPGLAPIFTGDAGPSGELAELVIAHLNVSLSLANSGVPILGMVVDAGVGVDLVIDPAGVGFAIGEPDPSNIVIDILDNPYNADVPSLQALLTTLLPSFFPELAGALDGIPLPAFLGLQLQPVEVSRQGDFITIFANLVVAP